MADEHATSRAGSDHGPPPVITRAIAFLLCGVLFGVAGVASVYSLAVEAWRLGTVFGGACSILGGVISWTLGIRGLILYRRARRTTDARG